MPNRVGNTGTAILVGAIAIVAMNGAAHAADNCLSGPKGAAPKGSHWYYRIDHATKRNCWYVRAEGGKPVAPQDSSISPASPPAEALLQPSVANARAEASPPEIAPSNMAAPMPVPSTGTTADIPQSTVDSRLLDGPGADSRNPSAPAADDSGLNADPSTSAAAPAPLAAAEAPPSTSRSGVHTLLLVIVGALAFAGFLVGAIFKLGSARQNVRQDIRRDWRAPWDSIKVDTAARSPAPAAAIPTPRIAAREPGEAIIPNEIVQLLSKLSREAAA